MGRQAKLKLNRREERKLQPKLKPIVNGTIEHVQLTLEEEETLSQFQRMVNEGTGEVYSREQIIRLALSKYIETVYTQARALAEQQRKQEQERLNGKSTGGNVDGDSSQAPAGTDVASGTLADPAGSSTPSEAIS